MTFILILMMLSFEFTLQYHVLLHCYVNVTFAAARTSADHSCPEFILTLASVPNVICTDIYFICLYIAVLLQPVKMTMTFISHLQLVTVE